MLKSNVHPPEWVNPTQKMTVGDCAILESDTTGFVRVNVKRVTDELLGADYCGSKHRGDDRGDDSGNDA